MASEMSNKTFSTAELERARNIELRVERNLKRKFSILFLLVAFVLGGGGVWIVQETTKETLKPAERAGERADAKLDLIDKHLVAADANIALRLSEVERLITRAEAEKRNEDALDSRLTLNKDRLDRLDDSVGQAHDIMVQLRNDMEAIQTIIKEAQPKVASALSENDKGLNDKLAQLNANIIKSAQAAEKAAFTIYPHYRRTDTSSVRFLGDVKKSLAEAGYVLGGASGDSDINDRKSDINSGPHVSYFIDPKNPQEAVKIKKAADDLVAVLNNIKPQGFANFVAKSHENLPDQTNLFGIWF